MQLYHEYYATNHKANDFHDFITNTSAGTEFVNRMKKKFLTFLQDEKNKVDDLFNQEQLQEQAKLNDCLQKNNLMDNGEIAECRCLRISFSYATVAGMDLKRDKEELQKIAKSFYIATSNVVVIGYIAFMTEDTTISGRKSVKMLEMLQRKIDFFNDSRLFSPFYSKPVHPSE